MKKLLIIQCGAHNVATPAQQAPHCPRPMVVVNSPRLGRNRLFTDGAAAGLSQHHVLDLLNSQSISGFQIVAASNFGGYHSTSITLTVVEAVLTPRMAAKLAGWLLVVGLQRLFGSALSASFCGIHAVRVPQHKGKPMADGPRYKMCGNSIAVPVIKWIFERISLCNYSIKQ